MPTLFFLHGADPTFRTTGQLAARFNEKLNLQEKVENLHVVVPDWRAETMPPLGQVNLTVPGGEFAPGADLAFPGSDLLGEFVNNLKNATEATILQRVAKGLTDHFETRRQDLMEAARSQLLGEVLGYNLYRTRIHAFVKEQLLAVPEDHRPIVVGGLSLGGIVAVDFLGDPANAKLPKECSVRSLVTIGSQSPILYAFAALTSFLTEDPVTKAPKAPGRPFTPWRNVYDPRDFLSFLAAPIFKSEYGLDLDVADIARESGKAFPDSHGFYFEDKPAVTWTTLADALNSATGPA